MCDRSLKSPARRYYLGCPGWASEDWVGSFYSTSRRRHWLRQYSGVFAAVEGNHTFYGLPKLDTVRRWAAQTSDGFRFVLKFPRVISHDRQLRNAATETDRFLEVLEILYEADKLGPAFLQLPPFFTGRQLPDLKAFLRDLPTKFRYSVESRHEDFFDQGPVEREFTQVLTELKIDRMLFDSRPLFSASPTDPWEKIAQSRKPQSPVRQTVTATHPVLRLIGRNDISTVRPWMEQWAGIVAGWIDRDLTPYIFTHAPDNRFAPQAAEQFHGILRQHIASLPAMAPWPARQVQHQQELFG